MLIFIKILNELTKVRVLLTLINRGTLFLEVADSIESEFNFNWLAWLIEEECLTHEQKLNAVRTPIQLSENRVFKVFCPWID